MPTLLDKTLKRALTIKGEPYVLTLSPLGFTLLPKGRRKGHEILWSDLVSGETALATALNASLQFNAENDGRGKKEPPAKAAGRTVGKTMARPRRKSPAAKAGVEKAPLKKR